MTTIEEVVSYMRKIQRRYPGIQVFFHDQRGNESRTGNDFVELDTAYITTLDLNDNLDPMSVNIPVE